MDRPDSARGAGGPSPGRIAIGRALLVIGVAILVGVLVLQTTRSPNATKAASHTSRSTAVTAPPRTTTTVPVTPRSQVHVLVANASTTNGVASQYTTVLTNAGWSLLTPTDATVTRPTSSIYYATGEHDQALVVAQALGVLPGAVLPLSATSPVTKTTGAEVVVVIGSDLAARTPPSTVPPTSTTTTTTEGTTRRH
ncbi:MAG: LytR C-terminal domain-containing protein [Acidimicrobiales bacterium]